MPRVIHFTATVKRSDGHGIDPALYDKILRKIQALLKRLGCTIHGEWRLGEPPDVEDLLG